MIIKNTDYNNSKKNINNSIHNYSKILNNKKKKNKIFNLEKDKKLNRDSKIINIEKERTSSLIQRQKNSITSSKYPNFNQLINTKLKSKNIFLNDNNKSALGHNLKKRKMDLSTESRNYSKGLSRHFNNSFNESLIDKKYLNTMVNIEKIPKNNYESNNQSNIMNTIDNEKLDISNDYTTIGKNSNTKGVKDIKNSKNENAVKRLSDIPGNKIIGSKNYYNTVNNEYSNNKQKKIVQNTTNSAVKRKNSYKKFNNKKHNKVFNSYNLIS